MAQPPRSKADHLRDQIDALTELERRLRLGLSVSTIEARYICGSIGLLFHGGDSRLVNPPLAITANGAWW